MPGRRRMHLSRAWLWPVLLGTLVVITVAAGAAAAIETDTVTSYWRGLWWSISLITTVGFVGEPPRTEVGALLSVVLMVVGFLLLAMVSASLAALFVREEEQPREERERAVEDAIVTSLLSLEARLASIEHRLAASPNDQADHPAGPPVSQSSSSPSAPRHPG